MDQDQMKTEYDDDKKLNKANFLTEEEKKSHHIASEQKRRLQIRQEFDNLVEIVPTLSKYENRSELAILTKSADYIDSLRLENDKLIEDLRAKNIEIPEELVFKRPN